MISKRGLASAGDFARRVEKVPVKVKRNSRLVLRPSKQFSINLKPRSFIEDEPSLREAMTRNEKEEW